MIFLDANVLLRVLTNDDPEKAQQCFDLLRKAERGEVQLATSEHVIAEVVYVLSSPRLYHLPAKRIRDLLLPILGLRGLKLPSRQVYRRALDIYALHNADFGDTLTVAHMRKWEVRTILSYDRHFDRIEGVERQEP